MYRPRHEESFEGCCCNIDPNRGGWLFAQSVLPSPVPLERRAQLSKLFTISAKYFQDVDTLCDIDDCHQMVASARNHLADGQNGLQNGTMDQSDWQEWFSENKLRLEGVQMALANVIQRQHFQNNVSELLQYETRRPACKVNAGFDPARCDRVFAEATAI